MSDQSKHLRDKDELYEVYDDSGIVTMYLTVSRGNSSEASILCACAPPMRTAIRRMRLTAT